VELHIVDLAQLDDGQIARAARILREALQNPTAYKAPGEAEAEVADVLGNPERFGFAALDGDDLVGWIGGIRGYFHSLELHPLVVDPARQRQGVGSRLLAALETRARAEGFLALHLGTDDDFGGTSLFGADLFPNVAGNIPGVTATARGHPFTFYARHGFEVVGLLPDANGPGKPDILMAKRL
jgi:aminoglycoside 6'-N-acetyltransferase I